MREKKAKKLLTNLNFPQRWGLLGVPFDKNSKIPGCSLGPTKILEYLRHQTPNFFVKNNITVLGCLNLLECPSALALQFIREKVVELISPSPKYIFLGGDHSITLPIIEAFSHYYKHIWIIYFDAHSDADDYLTLRNWNIFKVLRDKGFDLINCGIRHESRILQKLNIPHYTSLEININSIEEIGNQLINTVGDNFVYISLDLDVLDPAFAPGVSSPISGGLCINQLLLLLRAIMKCNVIGIDIVEFNPLFDFHNLTLLAIHRIFLFLVEDWPATRK